MTDKQPLAHPLTRLILIYTVFLGVAISYFWAAAGALFLSRFTIEDLPYAILLGGVAVLLTQLVYERFTHLIPPSLLLMGSLVFLILLTITLSAMAYESVQFSLIVWVRVLMVLLSLGFWSLAKRLFQTH